MDVIRFHNPNDPMRMEQASVVNTLTSKMWVERYADAGEFKFVAPANVGIRNLLPIGSFVSHVDTSEIMIVENHEINDVSGQDSQIIITGRGFETFFEDRIVGSNRPFPVSADGSNYPILPDLLWNQIVTLINDHILVSELLDAGNALGYVTTMTQISDSGESVARSLQIGSLYQRVLDLLAVDTLGIKVVRPGPWSPLDPGDPNTAVLIHFGVDRTSQIIFSHDTNEIASADYLWSNKANKNAALIVGRWVQTTVIPSDVGYARRMILVDASDVDQNFPAAPTGADLDLVVAIMQQRGREALAAQNDVALTKVEVSKNSSKITYRKDFDVGDLITVTGSYNESSIMRISEYVEIEDETGFTSYPTLSVI